MIRRPPRSTLFPLHDALPISLDGAAGQAEASRQGQRRAARLKLVHVLGRSEEHTSELQSRLHLVCRLLLEKKKRRARDRVRAEGLGLEVRHAAVTDLRTAGIA